MARRRVDPTGPDGAPRDDGLDARWSSDYLAIVSTHPELREYALGLCSLSWDQGVREHANGRGNPFWGLDTEAADAAQQPKEHAMSEQTLTPGQPVIVDPPATVVVRPTLKTWAVDTGVRALKTFAQSTLGAMVVGQAATTALDIQSIPWQGSVSIGAASAVLCVLQNVQSIPLGSNQG